MMILKTATSPALIGIHQSFATKDEAIRHMVGQLFAAGKLESEEEFYNAVMLREGQSPTGMEGGLAIPHGKSETVIEAAFAVATLQQPLNDWESVDPENRVELVIMLAIPKNQAGKEHLKLLSTLSVRAADPAYREQLLQSKTSEQLFERLDEVRQEDIQHFPDPVASQKLILAVTACPAGIAHTYMAAEALVKAGREMGVTVYVEKQGANGIEDRHSTERLNNATAVIFANDVAVKEEERFFHLPKIKTSVAAPLKNAKGILQQALDQANSHPKREPDQIVSNHNEIELESSGRRFKKDVKESVLTGISYIIPIIVAGGMTSAFATLIAQGFHLEELLKLEGSWLFMVKQLGGTLLSTLMVPILAAYMSYSLADKPGLAPGFAAGVAANMIGSGFLGGMLGGLLAGYLLRWMKKTIKPKGTFAGFISFWIYPVVGTLVVGLAMLFVVGEPLAYVNEGLINWLQTLSGANALLLGAIIGAMVSFDLGGPVNKAAYTFCIGAMASGNFIPYATFASVKMVSAFSITGATIIGKKYFSQQEREVGKQTWLLGLAGITEGAIPFMMNDPLRVIPSLIGGSVVTGAIVAYSNIGLTVPGAGIFSLALLEGRTAFVAAAIWLGAALVGAFISMLLLIVTRKSKVNKKNNMTSVV